MSVKGANELGGALGYAMLNSAHVSMMQSKSQHPTNTKSDPSIP